MPANVVLLVEDELPIRFFGPTPRALVELVGERAHRNRNRDAAGVEEASLFSQ